MEHRDGTQPGNPLIDTRQVMYVALHAVVNAYLDKQLTLDDLISMQTELGYNSHKLEDAFGDHPFFQLEGEIEWLHTDLIAGPEVGFTYTEENFREGLIKFLQTGKNTYTKVISENFQLQS